MVVYAVQWQDTYEPWGWETLRLFSAEDEADRWRDMTSIEDTLDGRYRVFALEIFERAADAGTVAVHSPEPAR